MRDHSDAARFATTRWSVVVAAGGADSRRAAAALEELCASYWYPLYFHARRRGVTADDSADLVQGFFAALLEKGWVGSADSGKGRFRTFLLTAFQRHAAHDHARGHAQKRDRDRVLPIDFTEAERRLFAEPMDGGLPPDRGFDRRWALTLLSHALERTRQELLARGSGAHFEELLPFLGGPGEVPKHADLAARLGTTAGAIKVAIHRLRDRFRDHLRAAIRDTVSTDAEVEEELRYLRDVLAGQA